MGLVCRCKPHPPDTVAAHKPWLLWQKSFDAPERTKELGGCQLSSWEFRDFLRRNRWQASCISNWELSREIY